MDVDDVDTESDDALSCSRVVSPRSIVSASGVSRKARDAPSHWHVAATTYGVGATRASDAARASSATPSRAPSRSSVSEVTARSPFSPSLNEGAFVAFVAFARSRSRSVDARSAPRSAGGDASTAAAAAVSGSRVIRSATPNRSSLVPSFMVSIAVAARRDSPSPISPKLLNASREFERLSLSLVWRAASVTAPKKDATAAPPLSMLGATRVRQPCLASSRLRDVEGTTRSLKVAASFSEAPLTRSATGCRWRAKSGIAEAPAEAASEPGSVDRSEAEASRLSVWSEAREWSSSASPPGSVPDASAVMPRGSRGARRRRARAGARRSGRPNAPRLLQQTSFVFVEPQPSRFPTSTSASRSWRAAETCG